MPKIVLLEDGETYGDLEGCFVVELTEDGMECVGGEDKKVRNLPPEMIIDYWSVSDLLESTVEGDGEGDE